jgi:hypothetical protein
MRKRLMVLLMAAFMVVMSAAPAMAARVRDPQPIVPPGRDIGQGMEPEQAADPQTGLLNRFERGSPQNGR